MIDMQNPADRLGGACGITSQARDTSQDTSAAATKQYELVKTVRKSSREEFRVAIRQFKHFTGVEIRVWQTNAAGEFVETPRGVAMRFDALPGVIDGLQQALRGLVSS